MLQIFLFTHAKKSVVIHGWLASALLRAEGPAMAELIPLKFRFIGSIGILRELNKQILIVSIQWRFPSKE